MDKLTPLTPDKIADIAALGERLGRPIRTVTGNMDGFHAPLLTEAATALTELLAEREGLIARVAVLEGAGENVLIGGNHLALLIGVRHPPYSTDPLDALEHYGASDAYEIWCAWRSLMHFRTALKEPTNG